FEQARLVGAKVWDDMAFGACAERSATTYVAGSTAAPSDSRTSCAIVPGRDYTSGEPCRCRVEARKPTLVGGNQGPLLRTSLECLYEVGVAAHLCQPTLREHQELMGLRAKEAKQYAEIAAGMRKARRQGPPSATEKQAFEQA